MKRGFKKKKGAVVLEKIVLAGAITALTGMTIGGVVTTSKKVGGNGSESIELMANDVIDKTGAHEGGAQPEVPEKPEIPYQVNGAFWASMTGGQYETTKLIKVGESIEVRTFYDKPDEDEKAKISYRAQFSENFGNIDDYLKLTPKGNNVVVTGLKEGKFYVTPSDGHTSGRFQEVTVTNNPQLSYWTVNVDGHGYDYSSNNGDKPLKVKKGSTVKLDISFTKESDRDLVDFDWKFFDLNPSVPIAITKLDKSSITATFNESGPARIIINDGIRSSYIFFLVE